MTESSLVVFLLMRNAYWEDGIWMPEDKRKAGRKEGEKRLKAGGGSPPLKDEQNCEIALSNA
jgi:hypothetical protein